jgi:cell division protein FtsI/penicillin-binding protein 2
MKFSRINPEWRYNLIVYWVGFILLIVVFRLFQIQVINSSRYKAQAREQQWSGYTLQSKRGTIFTNDSYPVATNKVAYTMYLNTTLLDASRDLFKEVHPILPDLDHHASDEVVNSKKKWIKYTENLNWDQFKQISDLNLPGVGFEETYSRYYPEGRMLSNTLGFVGKDQYAEDIGYYGLEQYYNGDLEGQNGWLFQERTAGGDPILWGDVEKVPPIDGSDLYLTINRNIQFMIEDKLKEAVDHYNAKSGVVIIVEPSTGAVISMATYPNFDPSDYKTAIENETLVRNDAISSVYEPGSVIKGITVASALDAGKINEDSIYNDTGPKEFSGYMVDNWDGKHHGEINIARILQLSNNLGAAWVAQQLGGDALMEYFHSFGFGQTTGIDLEGEEKGLMYGAENLKDIELANASFGQGISMTPLQVTMSFAAIANDGLLMKPYVVKKIVTKDKEVEFKPHAISRPVTTDTASRMVTLLTSAVSGGEAKFFVSKKYNIAGKTGTAQVPVPGGYDPNRTNATFVGFMPSYKNFVLYVKLEEPTSPSGYAAETAVPLWMSIAEKLAAYYGLAADKVVEKKL